MLKRFTQLGLLCLILTLTFFISHKTHAATISDFIVPRGFTFNRDLVKGTTTIPDVYFLQNLLNMSTSTRVSENDSGANGKLTAYYGDKTARAVGRFQSVFRTDIEYEKSISTTPGAQDYKLNPNRVDQYSRAVLNKLVTIYNYQLDAYKRVNQTTSVLPFSSTTKFKTDEEKNEEKFDVKKGGFQYSPNGLLLKLIGGDKLVDQVYSYTPTGMIDGGGLGGAAGAAAGIGGAAGAGFGASASGLFNFGGKTVSMTTCSCSFNLLLYVLDPRGATTPLIYQPGATILYKMYTPTVGVNVLGQYTTGGQCLVYVGTGCSSGGTPTGTMIQLGTSSL